MSFRSWLRKWAPGKTRKEPRSRQRRPATYRPRHEVLESRTVPSAAGLDWLPPLGSLVAAGPVAPAAEVVHDPSVGNGQDIADAPGNNQPTLDVAEGDLIAFPNDGIGDASAVIDATLADGSKQEIFIERDTGKPFIRHPDGSKEYVDYIWENEPADEPQQVSGFFLWGATRGLSDTRAVSFDDVRQGASDTCAFSAVLSAVARTDFDLKSGITLYRYLGDDRFLFKVRFYQADAQGVYRSVYRDVEFDRNIYLDDLHSTDNGEYWMTLYLRGYLQYQQDVGGNYQSIAQAFRALTGYSSEQFRPDGDPRADAARIRDALNAGRPVVAGTIDDEPRLLDGRAGLIHNHAYTVLGVELPPSGTSGITVTLRNPWAQDTHWSVFDADGNGDLSFEEWADLQWGLDGNNDGIVRVPWEKFARYFDHVLVNNRTGPAINTSLTNQVPVFADPDIGPFTVREGEVLSLDLSAQSADGEVVRYALKQGNPGYLHPYSGEYTWEPLAGEAGSYTITLAAETSPFSSVTLSFVVTVTSGSPRVGSLTVSPASITDAGTELVTLTAHDVVHDFDDVDFVEFWRDDSFFPDGQFYEHGDTFLGRDENGSDGWSWSGYVGGLLPGGQTFYARAGRYSFSDLHWSEVVSVPVTVTAAPQLDPAAVPADEQLLATPDWNSGRRQHGYALTADAAGNLYTFWNEVVFVPNGSGGSDRVDQSWLRRFDAAGNPLTGQVLLSGDTAFHDVAMLADGTFAAVWTSGANLYVQWHNPDGSRLGGRVTASTDAWAQNPHAEVAADANGNLLIVFTRGGYFSEDAYAVSVSRGGSVTRAPWRLNTHANSMQKHPTVALNESGAGVVAWTDFDQGKVVARRVTGYGRSSGAEFTVYAGNVAADSTIAAAVNGPGEFLVAWQAYTDGWTATSGLDVHARRYAADGQPQGDAFRVNTFRGDDQTLPQVALNDAGWAVAAWMSYGQDPTFTGRNAGLYAQVYDPQGDPAGPEFLVPEDYYYDQLLGGLVLDADADPTFAWTHSYGGDSANVWFRPFRTNLAPRLTGPAAFVLAENSPAGTVVGSVQAADPDGDGLTYALAGDSPFAIDPQTGRLTVREPLALDFEQTPRFVLTVRVTDDADPSQNSLGTVVVDLTNVNDAPTVLDVAFTIPELSPAGTIVGRVPASDQDAGDRLVYALVGDGPFAIDPRAGVLTVRDRLALDYEAVTSFSLTVEVRDQGTSSRASTAAVTVRLTDVNEAALPWAQVGGPAEGVMGQSRPFTLQAGGGAGPFTFTIDWDGDGSADQVATGPSGLRVSHTFAEPGSYAVRVTAADQDGGLSLPAAWTVAVGEGTAHQRYILRAYRDLLLRPAEDAGLAHWAGQLDRGVPRSEVARGLTRSAEYYATNVVRPAYRRFLGREAEQAGLQYWVGRLQAGLTIEQLEAGFLASDEYFGRAGRDNATWVVAMYRDLLGRRPEPGGVEYWVGKLQSGTTRQEVAYGFAASDEREAIAVRGYYRTFLGREASQAEVDGWVAAFRQGVRQEDVVTGFVGSDEYFRRHALLVV